MCFLVASNAKIYPGPLEQTLQGLPETRNPRKKNYLKNNPLFSFRIT